MSRRRDRANFDDPITPSLDTGFIGFETRRDPGLLEPGIMSFAQNIRIEDSNAEVRAGVDRLTADILDEGDPLFLPFTLAGERAVASITRIGSTATVTLSDTPITPYANGDEVEIKGADQSEYNGSFTLTFVSSTVFTITVAGTPATPATGTITSSPVLGPPTDGVFASTLFSDVDTNKEYVAMATLDKVILVDPDNPTDTLDIFYAEDSPVEEQFEITDNGDMLQVGNGLLINRGKFKKALEWDGNLSPTEARNVTSMTRSGTTVTVNTDLEHEYRLGDIITIAGAVETDYNGTHTITNIVDDDTYEFEIATTPTSPATGTITSALRPQFEIRKDTNFPGFLSMPDAEFSEYHPFARLAIPLRVLEQDLISITRSGAVATATTANNHGLLKGDRINILGAGQTEYNGIFEITDTTEKTFDYLVVGAPLTPASGSKKRVRVDVRDQFIVSDIYDHRTYDPVNNLFRINRGTADSLVGLKTFQNDNFLALYEKSIHVITDISSPNLDQDASIYLITDEVGVVARKTAEIIGRNLIFLSEQGVYMLEITPEINLRGREIPLSEDIQDEFSKEKLNYNKITDSVATYFNNRYYIAVPAAGSDRNNIVFVYNFINNKWESKDTFGSDNFIDNWVVCKKDGKDRLFATSLEGSLQLYEELDHDELGSVPTDTEIPAQIITREYNGAGPMGRMEVKKFHRGSLNITSKNGDDIDVTAITRDPDSTVTSANYAFTADEECLKRFRINKRGTGCRIQVDVNAGRPKIRSSSVEHSETQRANKTFE